MRLIDADLLRRELIESHDLIGAKYVDLAPTVDAVPVVRCGDCIHQFFCRDPLNREPDDFCSDGIPRGECDE